MLRPRSKLAPAKMRLQIRASRCDECELPTDPMHRIRQAMHGNRRRAYRSLGRWPEHTEEFARCLRWPVRTGRHARRPTRHRARSRLSSEVDPDRAAAGSSRFQRQDLVVQVTSGEVQCLSDILVFELGIFRLQLVPIRVEGSGLNDTPHRQAHPSNARLPVHDRWIDSYAVKLTCHGVAPKQDKIQLDHSIDAAAQRSPRRAAGEVISLATRRVPLGMQRSLWL